jgi:hypothetical protein
MDIIYHHTQRDLVKINPQKSDLICYNTSSERKVNIGDCKVSRSTCTKYLGISRNEKNSINIDEKLKSGRAAIYGMLGEGLQFLDDYLCHFLLRCPILHCCSIYIKMLRVVTWRMSYKGQILRALHGRLCTPLGCLIRVRYCLPFTDACVHPWDVL